MFDMKIKAQVAYKVCKMTYNGTTISAVSTFRGQMIVDYSIDHLSRPQSLSNPFLFVFDTLQNAKVFMRKRAGDEEQYCIFKGVAINTKQRAKTLVSRTYGHKTLYATSFPKGTLFCEAFVTLEQLKY